MGVYGKTISLKPFVFRWELTNPSISIILFCDGTFYFVFENTFVRKVIRFCLLDLVYDKKNLPRPTKNLKKAIHLNIQHLLYFKRYRRFWISLSLVDKFHYKGKKNNLLIIFYPFIISHLLSLAVCYYRAAFIAWRKQFNNHNAHMRAISKVSRDFYYS